MISIKNKINRYKNNEIKSNRKRKNKLITAWTYDEKQSFLFAVKQYNLINVNKIQEHIKTKNYIRVKLFIEK